MEKQDKEPIIIKKYSNRRLYDTQTSQYVNFSDLYEMVIRGEDFVVRDAKTEKDITRIVLTQIIFEQESAGGSNLLPVSFLKQLITLYDTNVGKVFSEYLKVTTDKFVESQDRMEELSNDWQQFTPMGVFENITKQNLEFFENAMKMFDPSGNKS